MIKSTPKERWNRVHGSILATVAALHEIVWVPIMPDRWKSADGQIWTMHSAPEKHHEYKCTPLLQAVARDALRVVERAAAAAQHHARGAWKVASLGVRLRCEQNSSEDGAKHRRQAPSKHVCVEGPGLRKGSVMRVISSHLSLIHI